MHPWQQVVAAAATGGAIALGGATCITCFPRTTGGERATRITPTATTTAKSSCDCRTLVSDSVATSVTEHSCTIKDPDTVLTELTAFAEELADATEAVLLRYFRSEALRSAGVAKKDLSATAAGSENAAERAASYPDIVTAADKEAERVMRAMVEARYPSHAIVGEEFGITGDPAEAQWCWVLDPIDGTAEFVCGTHQWGTLIGLCKDGAPIIGVINQPFSKDRWVGCRGAPTLYNGVATRCATCESLDSARLLASGSGLGALVEEDWVTCAHALVQATRTASFAGPNAYGWGLLASGCVDVLLDASDSEIYDIAAAIPIVEGAGGRVLSYDGTALDQGTVLPLASDLTFGAVGLGDAGTLAAPVSKLLEQAAWLSKGF